MIFIDLDSAARAMLDAAGVQRYERHKADLIADGTSDVDIDAILRGFIWDEAEMLENNRSAQD